MLAWLLWLDWLDWNVKKTPTLESGEGSCYNDVVIGTGDDGESNQSFRRLKESGVTAESAARGRLAKFTPELPC